MTSIAKLLGITQPAIGYSAEWGERLAKKEKYDVTAQVDRLKVEG